MEGGCKYHQQRGANAVRQALDLQADMMARVVGSDVSGRGSCNRRWR
jgi:hypothetical protein